MKILSKQNGFKIGDIYLMEFCGDGSEQRGIRPGLIISNNKGNTFSPNVIALPLTTSMKKLSQPTHVILLADETGLERDSIVLCENPERMSKKRIKKYITSLSLKQMSEVAKGFLLATSAVSFLEQDALLETYHKAISLNATSVA